MRKGIQKAGWLAAALVGFSACTPIADGVQKTGQNTKQMVDDTRDAWTGIFTYTPKKPEQLPQTRYCYHTMTDVVCYDSVQPTLTSHLDGYQDGENISWIQPGGGSLGVSGGIPTAAPGADHAQVSPMAQAAVDVTSTSAPTSSADTITSGPVTTLAAPDKQKPAAPVAAAAAAPSPTSPFYHKESPYVAPAATN